MFTVASIMLVATTILMRGMIMAAAEIAKVWPQFCDYYVKSRQN